MKLKVDVITQTLSNGDRLGLLTRRCPYPSKCSSINPPMIGSMACHSCAQCKSWADGFVYCKAGDKARNTNGI